MDWRSHFTAIWFAEWQKAQLQEPQAYARTYDELRRRIAVPADLVPSFETTGALTAETVRDVYTFGNLVGRLIGRLLTLPPDGIAAGAEWSGRFNLGISLFDYVADEANGGDLLASTPLFARFHSGPAPRTFPAAQPPSAATAALLHVADDVLSRLQRVAGADDNGESADPVWHALRKMMSAELLMSTSRANGPGCIDALVLAARAKSADPFACIADVMCLSSAVDGTFREQARTLGAAIGECFWLIDDARDLWEDFDRDRWNVFLLLAASPDDAAAGRSTDIDAEIRLSRVVMGRKWLRHIVTPVVQRLKDAIASTPADAATRQEVTGCLAIAMQRWLSP